jgi:hypothetical protein
MRKLLLTLLLACGTEHHGPTCYQAIHQFYEAGCRYLNTVSFSLYSEDDMVTLCEQLEGTEPSSCRDELDGWLECIYATTDDKTCSACQRETADAFLCK